MPSKNAVRIILIDIALICMFETKAIPFVISKIPVINGEANGVGICSNLKQGDTNNVKILSNLLALNIEIITENKTTNPPIIIIVEVALKIEFDNISPKFEKAIFFDSWEELLEVLLKGEFFFQNLNKNPTVIQESKCVIKSKKPISELPNIFIPTVPIINKGPELLVKLRSLSHSSLGKIFFSLKLHAIFAPIGYPLIIPIIRAKEPSPPILNKGLIKILKSLPRKCGIFVLESNSVATKKGNKDGTTEVPHKINPDFAATRLEEENITKHIVNSNIKIGIMFFLIFIT